jgi:endoglucanase
MTRLGFVLFLLAFGVARASTDQDVVLRLDFDAEATQALLVQNADASGSVTRLFDVPADRIAGQLITISADVKADGVSAPPHTWNGIKVMLSLDVGQGKEYPQLSLPTGTFDWTPASRMVRVPKDTHRAQLVLGLEQVSGRAWFDNVELRLGRAARAGVRQKTLFTGHDEPRLRGVMYVPHPKEEDLRNLAQNWHANLVRLQINWVPMKDAEVQARDLDAFDRWLNGLLPDIDKGVDLCEKYGVRVALDLHTPPGGRVEGGVCPLFSDPRCQDKLVEVWQRLARRYKGRNIIWAYDLLNEPVEPPAGPGVVSWRDLATRVTKAIRQIDPGKPVIFEPAPWGNPEGFDSLVPLDADHVIYSFHMYEPHAFTHQGIYGNPTGVSYPGVIAGRRWDKEQLREAMAPAIDFAREFNVQMYVGEFSAIRWAPDDSAYRYLRDCIDIFEENGWDWSYHAYREWDGWSVEHGPDPNDHQPTAEPTSRERLLLSWFARDREDG